MNVAEPRYKLERELCVSLPFTVAKDFVYGDRYSISGSRIHLEAGYEYDGCSPAIRLFGKWHGIPGLKKASAVHDALYDKRCCNRWNADFAFLYVGLFVEFKIWRTMLYYCFIRAFGRIWWKK